MSSVFYRVCSSRVRYLHYLSVWLCPRYSAHVNQAGVRMISGAGAHGAENLIPVWPFKHPQVTMARLHQLLQGAPGVSKENAGSREHEFRGVWVQKYRWVHPPNYSNTAQLQYSSFSRLCCVTAGPDFSPGKPKQKKKKKQTRLLLGLNSVAIVPSGVMRENGTMIHCRHSH